MHFDDLAGALERREVDFVADPIYKTESRTLLYRFCRTYSRFDVAVAVVRKKEQRFRHFADLNQPGTRIVLAEGWTSTEYAQANLPAARNTFQYVKIRGDASIQMDLVRDGQADAALNDVPTVLQYVLRNKETVKALWLNNPPLQVEGSFITRRDDRDLCDFLNELLTKAIADGILLELDQKWKTLGLLPSHEYKRGSGLSRYKA